MVISRLLVLPLPLALLLAGPAAAQAQLRQNPLPAAYRGVPPQGLPATPGPVMRVRLRATDADGRPLARALVRVAGSVQQLWTDEQGLLSLLVTLERGPLQLTCSAYGYESAELTIARPEDNNLVFLMPRRATDPLTEPADAP